MGSLLGDEEDLNRRKQLATASMNKINAIYLKKDKVKLEKQIRIYRALVKSVLLYDMGSFIKCTTEIGCIWISPKLFKKNSRNKISNTHIE